MSALELLMYEIGRVFLVPVLLLILALFVYAFLALGAFLWETWQRRTGSAPCPLRAHLGKHQDSDGEHLELLALKQLEPLRIVTRTAPMLGLVATMIPLGPALLALGDGDLGSVGEHLVVAFAAVILALITASLTHWILTVRRRWLMSSLKELEDQGAIS